MASLVLMLPLQIALWAEEVVHTADSHFHCWECSQSTPSAIQTAEGAAQGASTGKNHKKILTFWSEPSMLWSVPGAAPGQWVVVPIRTGPTGVTWGHCRAGSIGLSDQGMNVFRLLIGFRLRSKWELQFQLKETYFGNSFMDCFKERYTFSLGYLLLKMLSSTAHYSPHPPQKRVKIMVWKSEWVVERRINHYLWMYLCHTLCEHLLWMFGNSRIFKCLIWMLAKI